MPPGTMSFSSPVPAVCRPSPKAQCRGCPWQRRSACRQALLTSDGGACEPGARSSARCLPWCRPSPKAEWPHAWDRQVVWKISLSPSTVKPDGVRALASVNDVLQQPGARRVPSVAQSSVPWVSLAEKISLSPSTVKSDGAALSPCPRSSARCRPWCRPSPKAECPYSWDR